MKDEVLIKAENVSKKFCRDLKRSLWYGVKDIASEMTGRTVNHDELRKDEFWAVQDVSFELKRGECLGLIGHNGAGKSTLLKILNGLIKPDKGKITMKGRIGALIELGAGFNPILTGRENIYVNGQILGFTKKEIDAKFNDIIEFAEIGEFIDTPVQNYSSGMKVRLGFAVASQMEPDVLLIDEVLAVGDVAFQVKCFNAIDKLIKDSAVIFVSHNMPQVAKVANKGIYLMQGEIKVNSDNLSNLINAYYDFSNNESIDYVGEDLRLEELQINGQDSVDKIIDVRYLEDISISFRYLPSKIDREVEIIIVIFDRALRPIAFVNSGEIRSHNNTKNRVHVTLPKNQLSIGIYNLGIQFSIKDPNKAVESRHIISYYRNLGSFKITGEQPINHAFFQLQGNWEFTT